jgi:hypothetical protein
MINHASRNSTLGHLRTALAVITLSVISAPLTATEKVAMNDVQAVTEARRFRNDMDLFRKTVELRFKADLAFKLKQSVVPPLRLTSALANNRG